MLNKTILQLSANLPVLDACIHCGKSLYLQHDPIVDVPKVLCDIMLIFSDRVIQYNVTFHYFL
jgi:hypothetical protein